MSSWAPPSLPARVAASRDLPLVGRRSELETFEAIWAEVERGRRQLVFIGGEPGAGKSRLMAEVAGALRDDGVTVLVGASNPDAGVPYQPFAEMLDHLFTGTAPGSLAGLLDDGGVELQRLSAHVTRHQPEVGASLADSGEVRRDLFDAVAGLFRRLADDGPLALVLEDLHWAQLPTLALLEHVVHASNGTRMLVLATFRSTAPDRSDEMAARVAELHRLDGVRRLDLSGLDTDAIAEYVVLRSGLPLREARAPAALLRDRTGGNPFFLRELWADLERRGGVSTLRFSQRVPASISDTLTARIDGLGGEIRQVIELAAVLGNEFDLATLLAAEGVDLAQTMAFVDSTTALGLIDMVDPDAGRYSFVHALTRQAVLDRMQPSRLTRLHVQAAEALERQPAHAALVPRLAHHYLAGHILGFHDRAVRYSREAGRLAEKSLAFEDAAVWFERASSLPECAPELRSELLLAAGADYVRACHFPHARAIYEQLAAADDPAVRLAAAVGFEDATWRPGAVGTRATDLLSAAVEGCQLDGHNPTYVRALASLGRALALGGETASAREVGGRAIDLARELGDEAVVLHALTAGLWHGITPDIAQRQRERSAEVIRLSRAARDYESLGAAANFHATVSYLVGRPTDLHEAIEDSRRAAEATGQPYFRHVHGCLACADAFLRGDFAGAERWAEETLTQTDTVGDELAEGPHGVQLFMIRRETDALGRFRAFLDGRESFAGRWVPGLLALYTELGVETGIRRALDHLLDRRLTARTDEAQWPMELVFMSEAALALDDLDAARVLRPLLVEYAGMNLVSGTLIATFGSADRLLARVAVLVGDHAAAARHFDVALAMDRRMRSVIHVAETVAYQALFAASAGRRDQARALADEARRLAGPIGHNRVIRILASVAPSAGPDGLSERETDVLRLLATGLSNQEIGAHLHISANTAANHVRSILMKTGAANRTQAAIYAAHHGLM
jgi:DNA-binding NarL/FixJ family response regulator/tetratricopeptide (TPR) repeat protein